MLIIGSGILTLSREKARGTPLPHSVVAEGQAGLVEAAAHKVGVASGPRAPRVAPAE